MTGVGLVTETKCTLTLTAHVYHGGRECESGYLRANIYIKVMGYSNLFPIFSNISTLALIRLPLNTFSTD